jgi:hypothetical protein
MTRTNVCKSTAVLALALGTVVVLNEARSTPRGTDTAGQKKFQARLLEIAKAYEPFGRVDDEARWAPYLCRMPNPGAARFSASKDANTHGQKLYSLFAKDRSAYRALSPKGQPVGQVIVKQSWVPQEVADKGQKLQPVVRMIGKVRPSSSPQGVAALTDSFLPYARKGGKLYKAAKQAELFIMYKLDPTTPGTDKGWVYGTVTADGKKVTSAGRVASCMKCHEKAAQDRVFGLPKK